MELVSGLDLVEVERFARISPAIKARFIQRVYTIREQEQARTDESLAGLFAAKEAVAKAIGCGIGEVGWREIEITRDGCGAPVLTLYGQAAESARSLGISKWSISITHTAGLAAAQAIGTG